MQVVYLRGISLTRAQRDSMDVLIQAQEARGKIEFREIWNSRAVQTDRRGADHRDDLRAAIDALFKSLRARNRAQLRAVLTPVQQAQFDRNVLKYDDEVAKQRIRYNPWW
jgi:Spy/CpxP family protein refolding chaperone